MAKYVIDGPKRGAPAPKEIKPSDNEYYSGDVLSAEPTVDYEAKGKEVLEASEKAIKEAKTWAATKFGSFFSAMRTRAGGMAEGVARALKITVGATASKGAEAAYLAGRTVVEAAKVPGYIAKGGVEVGKFVAGEASDVLEATGEVLGTGVGKTVEAGIAGAKYIKENRKVFTEKAMQGVKDAVMYDDLKEMGGNLVEAAKWANSDESGEAIKGFVSDVGRSVGEVGKVAKLSFEQARAYATNTKQSLGERTKEIAEGGLAESVRMVNDVKDALRERKHDLGEVAERSLGRVEANLQRGETRLNELYDRGVDAYAEYNGRVTKAKSAWDEFRNAGRQALEAFTSIFGGRSSEKKKLAEGVVKAIDAQRALNDAESEEVGS